MTRGVHIRKDDISFRASYEAEEGAAFAETFLRQPARPTAVVLGSDALAMGFIRAVQRRGVQVPDDLSVARSTAFRKVRVVAGCDDDGAADAGDGTGCLPSFVHGDYRARGADDRAAVFDDAGRAREHGSAATRIS